MTSCENIYDRCARMLVDELVKAREDAGQVHHSEARSRYVGDARFKIIVVADHIINNYPSLVESEMAEDLIKDIVLMDAVGGARLE